MTPAQRAAHARMLATLPVRTIDARHEDFDEGLIIPTIGSPRTPRTINGDPNLSRAIEVTVTRRYRNIKLAAQGLRCTVGRVRRLISEGRAQYIS